jgi:hypothetical protein
MVTLKTARLIGITGVMGSGKDTVANLIIAMRPRELRRYSFATPLKNGVKAMFGWTDEQIEDRVFKEAIDPRWGFSPRKAMQLLGTEYGRERLRNDLWVHAGENFHEASLTSQRGTIITDVRFENEASWVRSRKDSLLIHVMNPDHDYGAKVNHVSENGIVYVYGDEVINNPKSQGIEYLTETLRSLS